MRLLSNRFSRGCALHITHQIDFFISRYYGLNVFQVLCRILKVSQDRDIIQYGICALQMGFPVGPYISKRNN